MHSTQLGNDWIAHHNGDYSGDVILINRLTIDHPSGEDTIHQTSLKIPFSCLEKLVAGKIRDERMDTIQDMTVEDLLYGSRP